MIKLKIALLAPNAAAIEDFANKLSKMPDISLYFDFDLLDNKDKLQLPGLQYTAYVSVDHHYQDHDAIFHWLYSHNVKRATPEAFLMNFPKEVFLIMGGKLEEPPKVLWSEQFPVKNGRYWLAMGHFNGEKYEANIELVHIQGDGGIILCHGRSYTPPDFVKFVGNIKLFFAPALLPALPQLFTIPISK